MEKQVVMINLTVSDDGILTMYSEVIPEEELQLCDLKAKIIVPESQLTFESCVPNSQMQLKQQLTYEQVQQEEEEEDECEKEKQVKSELTNPDKYPMYIKQNSQVYEEVKEPTQQNAEIASCLSNSPLATIDSNIPNTLMNGISDSLSESDICILENVDDAFVYEIETGNENVGFPQLYDVNDAVLYETETEKENVGFPQLSEIDSLINSTLRCEDEEQYNGSFLLDDDRLNNNISISDIAGDTNEIVAPANHIAEKVHHTVKSSPPSPVNQYQNLILNEDWKKRKRQDDHNEVEKKRRRTISEQLFRLTQLLPDMNSRDSDVKITEAETLKNTCKYIQQLENDKKFLEKEIRKKNTEEKNKKLKLIMQILERRLEGYSTCAENPIETNPGSIALEAMQETKSQNEGTE